jgi:hypothetical protein
MLWYHVLCCGVLCRDSLQKRMKTQKIPFPGLELRDGIRRSSLKLAPAYVAEVLKVGPACCCCCCYVFLYMCGTQLSHCCYLSAVHAIHKL